MKDKFRTWRKRIPSESDLLEMLEAAVHSELKLNSYIQPKPENILTDSKLYPLDFGDSTSRPDGRLILEYANPNWDPNNEDSPYTIYFEISIKKLDELP